MTSPCPDRETQLQALLDGELDAAHALATEAHLKTCSGCATYVNTLQALRTRLVEADLSPRAPDRLRASIDAMLAEEDRKAARASRRDPLRRWLSSATAGWTAAGAMAAVAAALLVAPVAPFSTTAARAAPDLETQLVSSHVRSLLASHLIDIATSDRHVVKPWFNGRIDYAPPVPDLAADGFPLAGGRLDYADNRVIAAVVYRHRAHVINLFILPRDATRETKVASSFEAKHDSYSVTRWSEGDLDFWAVSDIDAPDLDAFRKAFLAATP